MAPACAAPGERALGSELCTSLKACPKFRLAESDLQQSSSRFYLCLQVAIDLQPLFEPADRGADRGIVRDAGFRPGAI